MTQPHYTHLPAVNGACLRAARAYQPLFDPFGPGYCKLVDYSAAKTSSEGDRRRDIKKYCADGYRAGTASLIS